MAVAINTAVGTHAVQVENVSEINEVLDYFQRDEILRSGNEASFVSLIPTSWREGDNTINGFILIYSVDTTDRFQ